VLERDDIVPPGYTVNVAENTGKTSSLDAA
jgi:hypothetical protein